MWFSFWRSRKPFSLDELRYLTDQLQKVQSVNDINKDFVIEALRSIAELVTYGDQHDPSFFDFFMEKQIMGEFVRVLNISRPAQVAVQLLQTMSIMIQNLRSEHAIYYIFSNEHINYLITYSFDFKNDELVSYYISFLRTISGKLNKHTISLLVKTQNDEVVSFPLYTKAIQFSVNDEKMVRIAVRALTLNVYHVGDESVNKFVSQTPVSDYFSDVVSKFREDCIKLDGLVSQAAMNTDLPDMSSKILSAVDEIEDTLYYFSDVISAGVPDLGRLITDNILQLLVFPLLLPSLKRKIHGAEIGITTSLYLLCCILRIVKTKELANTIATTLFFPPEAFIPKSEATANGYGPEHSDSQEHQQAVPHSVAVQADAGSSGASILDIPGSSGYDSACYSSSRSNSPHMTLRELLLSYIVSGDDIQVLGCLCLLSTLLQTKELDESMLDGLGILPQRKQHKKLLLQALVGEGSAEEQLFSSENSVVKDNILPEIDKYMQHLKDQYGLSVCLPAQGTNSQTERSQVLDALVSLFCRDDLSAETLWTGGWLLRQLLPNGEKEFTTNHLKQLKDSNNISTANMYGEAKGIWCDVLISVLIDEWGNCKRAMEAASPHKEPRSILLPSQDCPSGGESSFTAGERMCELVKIFVLQRQLLIFSCGGFLHDQPPVNSPVKSPENSRAKTAGLDVASPKPGSEISLDNALPCRIAFERGKERHFSFLAISRKTSGWILLAEELPLKQQHGVVRVTAPLAGSDPKIDDKHPKWLHLRIRPSSLPFRDPPRHDAFSKEKSKVLVDGRWTLAFRDAESCKLAETMLIEEMRQQSGEVEKRLKPFLDLEAPGCGPDSNISP